jgi:hypothetical protein
VESKLLSKSDRTLADTDQLVEKVSLRLGGKNLVGYLSSPPPPFPHWFPTTPRGLKLVPTADHKAEVGFLFMTHDIQLEACLTFKEAVIQKGTRNLKIIIPPPLPE